MEEPVFMHQPDGFKDPEKTHHVCKLTKAIYGLKQTPRVWFDRLKTTLIEWGFDQNTKSDSSLFSQRGKNHITFLLIYVDEIIVTGSNPNFLRAFIKQLNECSHSRSLGGNKESAKISSRNYGLQPAHQAINRS